MKVIFHTSLDRYQGDIWPKMPTNYGGIIPRTGDFVRVLNPEGFIHKGLPTYLVVTAVLYINPDSDNNPNLTEAICELWYTDSQVKLYDKKVLMGQ